MARNGRGRVGAARAAVPLVWMAATLLGLGVAATTRIGPVLLTVSAGHGLHLGDLAAFTAAYAVALVITRRGRRVDVIMDRTAEARRPSGPNPTERRP